MNKKTYRLVLAVFLLLKLNIALSQGTQMRRCAVLPVIDNFGDALGFKIFEKVENYLKESKWCEYQSNSDMLEVFSKYRSSLGEHLEDPKVIETFAKRLSVGTIIRIKIQNEEQKIRLYLDVIGANGVDIYLGESILLEKVELDSIDGTIRTWLEIYEANIPYEGTIIGVLGEQLTFSIEKDMPISIGQKIKIKRYVSKKEHPLLKKIVAWESKLVGRAKIVSISQKQGFGQLVLLLDQKNIMQGDWVEFEQSEGIPEEKIREGEEHDSMGKLGIVSVNPGILNPTASGTKSGSRTAFSGNVFSIGTSVEAWITREYFGIFEYTKASGDIKKSAGSPSSSTVEYSVGTMKFGGGYKYLPLGFFWGPQINFYGGFAKYTHDIEKLSSSGVGSMSLSGLYLGIGGSIPFSKGIRLQGKGEMMPLPKFTDEDNVYGNAKSINSLLIGFGAEYQYRPNMFFEGGFESINNIVKFGGSTSSTSHKNNALTIKCKFGF